MLFDEIEIKRRIRYRSLLNKAERIDRTIDSANLLTDVEKATRRLHASWLRIEANALYNTNSTYSSSN